MKLFRNTRNLQPFALMHRHYMRQFGSLHQVAEPNESVSERAGML